MQRVFQLRPRYDQVSLDDQESTQSVSNPATSSPAAITNVYRPSPPSDNPGRTTTPLQSPPGSKIPQQTTFYPPPPPPGFPSVPPSPLLVPPTPSTVKPMPSPYSAGSLYSIDTYGHIRDSTSAIWSEYDEWKEYIHPNGSLYWTCSAYPARVVSDIKPPLSNLHTSAPSTISRIMHALGEIPQITGYHNWEIYTDGSSCVYIDHGSRSASDAFETLADFRGKIERLQGQMDIKSKLRFESAYWAFMQSHPNHRDLPDGAVDDATEAVVWCHADRALFKSSNAPFSQDDAREMTELMKTITDLNRPILKTWYCASILRAICKDRLASHYGQNDAREVRRRERAEDVELSLPFGSVWDKITWHTITLVSLGAPLGYLKRIHNVDRTQTGDGVNTLRWRAFLKSLCKEWTDSNLLATVLVSATVALLAIPEINGMARIAGLLSALYALSSVLCGMLLISNHQDRVESFGSTGVVYFDQAKARSTGTTRPLALILSLPLAFMLWGMFWFVLAVMSCAYGPSPEDQLPHRYIAAARYICFIFFSVLAIAGGLVLRFFHGIWNSPTPAKRPTHAEPTAADMVAEQGGNPLMLFSGDQHLDPPTPGVDYVPDPYKSSFANPLQAGRLSPFSPDGGVPASRPTVSMPVTNFARPSATDPIVNVARPPTLPTTNIARPPTYNSQLRPTGPVAITNQPFSHAASPMAAVVSSRPAERSESLPGYSSK